MEKLIITIIFILAISLTCNIIEPEAVIKPGRRDYVWTVDTLTIPEGFFYPSRIWGSSADNIWLVGFGSPTTNLVWHFDGTIWENDRVGRSINPSALWGFGPNDIWMGNTGSDIWHYNGTQWYKHTEIIPPSGFDQITIENIWGRRSNDVWGVGGTDQFDGGIEYKGIIMHYDGKQWTFKNIPIIRVGFTRIRHQQASGSYFLSGWRFEQTTADTCKVYKYDGKGTLTEIYSDIYPMSISEINGEIYFFSQRKIYKYINNKLSLWKDFSGEHYMGWLVGRSEMDMFGVAPNRDIVHYNGTDWVTLYPNSYNIATVLLVDNCVFFVCEDYSTGLRIIIRGQL